MRRFHIAVWLLVGLVLADDRAVSADDRPSRRRILSSASIYFPITRYTLADSLKEIAAATNVLFGSEAVDDPSEGDEETERVRRWSVRGLFVSQALDLLTQEDGRYGWREIDGRASDRPSKDGGEGQN